MTYTITLSDGMVVKVTEEQLKFALCWGSTAGKLLCNPQDLDSTQETQED